MCVIAVSKKGITQPSVDSLRSMWNRNPDGAGYMTVRNGKVEIHKGFLYWDDFIRSVKAEKFTVADPVVYHFRIATQGGINEEMTHPFPLTSKLELMNVLDVACDIGVAHNGIIPMTTERNNLSYSDTALFITRYMSCIVRSVTDLHNARIQEILAELAMSKLAIMDKNGEIVTIGKFYDDNGILISNENHLWKYEHSFQKGDFAKCIV